MRDSPDSTLASGVYAALLTPRIGESTETDAGSLLEYIDKVSASGIDGLVLFGSTGEFIHFDLAERTRTLALAAKRSRLPILVNVSHSSLAGAISLAEQAVAAGASGLLLMPPYFYRLGDELVAEFYTCFLKNLGEAVPVYLYNLPQCTEELSAGITDRLLSTGSFAGIKSSDASWTKFEQLLALRQRRSFQLLVGNERLYLNALSEGADGSVSGVAAAIPELPVAIYRAVKSGESRTAARLAQKLDELMIWIDKLPPILALKQLAELRSWVRFDPAIPIDSATRNDLGQFCRWLEDWLPGALAACREISPPSVRT
jgi:dihydrodipicolinate synthase/N-acetylneuraminate lyase